MQTPEEFAASALWDYETGGLEADDFADLIRARDAEVLREAAEGFATGGWHDAWMTDGVDDDVSAVRSTEKWLIRRAEAIERGEQP